MDASELRPCPFCAHEAPTHAAVGRDRVERLAVICLECGAVGPMATGEDPPGHAELLWNHRFGMQQAMARVLCLVCHYATPQLARIGGAVSCYLHCRQGVPGGGTRTACPLFMREPGADDEWPRQPRGRGRWPVVGVAV